MIVRSLDSIKGTDREVKAENGSWVSRRLLLKKDGTSYSFHDTVLREGMEVPIWYKNHIEAVYCLEGKGQIELKEKGEVIPLEPGVLYVLDKHEKHVVKAVETFRFICIFTPPLTGNETHDEEGSYPLLD